MKGEHVDVVSPPGQGLTISRNDKTCKIVDRSRRSVLAGDPVWIFESERPGLDRDAQARMKDFARRIAEVERNLDRLSILCKCGACREKEAEDPFQVLIIEADAIAERLDWSLVVDFRSRRSRQ